MLLIPCPHCGPRDEAEFSYGGPVRPLPPLDHAATVQDWHAAIHLGVSALGPQPEIWYHHAGCECWITALRDLASHEFAEGDL
ncbi:MAG: sarcosine oxidase subunit delta [Albidovulum sp.]